jgi:hypothetical protein
MNQFSERHSGERRGGKRSLAVRSGPPIRMADHGDPRDELTGVQPAPNAVRPSDWPKVVRPHTARPPRAPAMTPRMPALATQPRVTDSPTSLIDGFQRGDEPICRRRNWKLETGKSPITNRKSPMARWPDEPMARIQARPCFRLTWEYNFICGVPALPTAR